MRGACAACLRAGPSRESELQLIVTIASVPAAVDGRDGRAFRDPRAGAHLPPDARRLVGAEQPWPRELGKHEQLHLDGGAAVHADGGDPARQRAVGPHLFGPREARRAPAGRPPPDQHRRLRHLRLGQRIEHRHGGVDRQRRPAATRQARLPAADGGRIARRGRHARHPAAAELRHDRLRHFHRDLGAQAVPGRPPARPDDDFAVHALHRFACALFPLRGAQGRGASIAEGTDARAARCLALRGADPRHARRHLCRPRHHDRRGDDRVPVRDRARQALGRADLRAVHASHARHGEIRRQYPVHHLFSLCLLLRHKLRGGRRGSHELGRRDSD